MTNVSDVKRQIMVVDDDDDIRLLLSSFLRAEGYSVIEAATADEAEAYALKHAPQLILMDLSLGGSDGLSAIWNIRRQPGMATVPIVIVSAHDAYDLRAEAAAAGCREYLTKPLDVIDLKKTIQSILEDD